MIPKEHWTKERIERWQEGVDRLDMEYVPVRLSSEKVRMEIVGEYLAGKKIVPTRLLGKDLSHYVQAY